MNVELLVRLSGQNKVRLVWDKLSIAKDKAINNDFVVMEQVPELHCGSDKFENLVIEGENYDALRWLRMTHKGKVQCIYIDPPYNAAAALDHYNDSFEVSEWLEFMAIRLKLARDLLTDDGIILVSIDDKNRAYLELLMDDLYAGFLKGSFTWRTSSGDNQQSEMNFFCVHEHVLFYAQPAFKFAGVKKSFSHYKNIDNDARGDWFSSDPTVSRDYDFNPNGYYPIQNPETGVWYPCNPDRIWAYSSSANIASDRKLRTQTMESFISEGRILFPKKERVETWDSMDQLLSAIDRSDVPKAGRITPILRRGLPNLDFWIGKPVGWGRPQFKKFKSDLKSDMQPVVSWIRQQSENDTDESAGGSISYRPRGDGAKLINKIFGYKAFPFPKPLSLIHGLVSQASRDDAIVLDFFAGSGTTAHAVLAVNKEDEGNRRFIMVSEANGKDPDNTLPYGKNLCKQVLAERIRRVIPCTGGNFAYLRTKLVPQMAVPFHLMSDAELWTLLQVAHGLPLKSGFEGPVEANSHANVSVIFSPLGRRVDVARVAEVLEKAEGAIFLYTWEEAAFKKFERRVSLRVLPDFLLNFGD